MTWGRLLSENGSRIKLGQIFSEFPLMQKTYNVLRFCFSWENKTKQNKKHFHLEGSTVGVKRTRRRKWKWIKIRMEKTHFKILLSLSFV